MLQGISVDERIEFTCLNDTSEPKTVFILKPLSGIEQFQFYEFYEDGKLKLKPTSVKTILLSSIVEIKNFTNKKLEEMIDSLDGVTAMALLNKIMEINKLTEKQEKN